MGYKHRNSKGVTYYLNAKTLSQRGTLFYFTKEVKDTACNLPAGMEVIENQRTFLPIVRRKKMTEAQATAQDKAQEN